MNLRKTIDCQYLDPGVGACFVLESDGEFALVESGTARSAPLILAELRALNVPFARIKYLIATHAHLDHAGGLHVLSASIPDAAVVLHPNAALHLAAPKTLVAGTKAVFGQQRYDEYFQEVRALDPEKILPVEHGRTLRVGSQDIEFLHTLGHATHHLCVWDRARGVVFTGDAFGMCYSFMRSRGRSVVLPLTPPMDFDPAEALHSIDLLESTRAKSMQLTHFGRLDDVSEGARQLRDRLAEIQVIVEELMGIAPSASPENHCLSRLLLCSRRAFEREGVELNASHWRFVERDVRINAAGILNYTRKLRKRSLAQS